MFSHLLRRWPSCYQYMEEHLLDHFDDIARNVANSYRLQEECDVCALVMAEHRGTINPGEFSAIMLASLRSLAPKDWDDQR